MSGWPPPWEDTFDLRNLETGPSLHHKKISDELRARLPHFQGMPSKLRMELSDTVHSIDRIASWSAVMLRKNALWTEEQLRYGPSPHPVRSKREFAQWQRFREYQFCIDYCAKALSAIFQGEFIFAIKHALYAGNHANGASAITGSKALQGIARRIDKIHPTTQRARNHKKIILLEAAAIRRRNSKLTPHAIADRIAANHASESGFPKPRTIRSYLAADKSWLNPS